MKNADFLAKLKQAVNTKTLYVLGAFGAPATASNKNKYSNYLDYNKKRKTMINAASADTFFFDCSGLIKGIIWGWKAEPNTNYGGAKYESNGLADINSLQMIQVCSDATTDFSKIEAGELLWMDGHVGVYMGDGLCIECSPKWNNGVQWSAVSNIGSKAGYNSRKWTKHGHLPFIDYTVEQKFNGQQPVNFIGGEYYGSANGVFAYHAPAGIATVIDFDKNAKHQYHIIGSTFSGFVDESAIENLSMTSYANPTGKATATLPVLVKGTKGEAVKTLKAILRAHGYDVDESEYFDATTDAAVRAMQKATALTVDGSVGQQTWEALIGG